MPRIQGKASTDREMTDSTVVGIDISKDWFDVCVHPGGKRFRLAIDAAGIAQLCKECVACSAGLVARRKRRQALQGRDHRGYAKAPDPCEHVAEGGSGVVSHSAVNRPFAAGYSNPHSADGAAFLCARANVGSLQVGASALFGSTDQASLVASYPSQAT